MNENLQETLSALMDNEADDLELRRLLKKLSEDKTLQEKWARYHLLSACLKQEAHSKLSVDLLTGIHAELENDAVPTSSFVSRSTGFIRYLGQGAIAASVALLVLFTAESITNTSNVDTSLAESTVNQDSPVLTNSNFNSSELARAAVINEDSSRRIDEAERARIQQAVYQQFEENSSPPEIPVNYTE